MNFNVFSASLRAIPCSSIQGRALLLPIILLLSACSVGTRDSSLVPPSTAPAAPTITGKQPWCKLLLTDTDGKILLVKWKGEWEVPGAEMPAGSDTSKQSCRDFIDHMAASYGLRIKDPRLRAVFHQRFRAGPDLGRQHRWYSAPVIAPLDSPPTSDLDIAWYGLDDAIIATPYPMAKGILRQLAAHPEDLWTAEYEVDYKVNPPGGDLRIIRDFHRLDR